MNCPACGYYNPLGAQTCFHCSLALPVPAAGDARCARHAEVQATGACSRCGTFGCGQCLTSQGTDWLCPACVERSGVLPWDERETIGLWRAWWRTSLKLIAAPIQTLSTAQPEASLSSSALYVTLSSLFGFGATFLLYGVGFAVAIAFVPDKTDAGLFVGLYLGCVVFLLVSQVGGLFVVAGVDHLGLLLFGAGPRSYAVTARAYALSTAPYLVGLLPLCGFYVFPLWSLVLRVLANIHLHRTTPGRATLAVIAPTLIIFFVLAGLYVAFIALAASIGR